MTEVNPDKEKRPEEIAADHGQSFKQLLESFARDKASADAKDGDYLITLVGEEAEGWYAPQLLGGLAWEEPDEEENQHLEVVVQDMQDLRFIPYLRIRLKLIRADGEEVEEKEQRFIWHPFIYHYGENWEIPEEGDYYGEITIKSPDFRRHDLARGKRYLEEVKVKVGPLHLTPGRKPQAKE
jgi:hypothetical protein